jgi:glucuronate isomerase
MTSVNRSTETTSEDTSVASAMLQSMQNRLIEHEVFFSDFICEISDLGHPKENQLARKETQLGPIKNTRLNGLVKLEVILLPALIEIERKYING